MSLATAHLLPSPNTGSGELHKKMSRTMGQTPDSLWRVTSAQMTGSSLCPQTEAINLLRKTNIASRVTPTTAQDRIGRETRPMQHSLGLCWEITKDTFSFRVSVSEKPFTLRGNPVNSQQPSRPGRSDNHKTEPYCGNSPQTLAIGIHHSPKGKLKEWEAWRNSLQLLKLLHISRTFTTNSLSKAKRTELYVFSDASNKAIAAVACLRATDKDVGFSLGKPS